VAKPIALRRELALLVGIGVGGLDLGELESQQVEISLPRSLPLANRRELARDRTDLAMGVAVSGAALQVVRPGEAVEDLELRG
jgi:hypothetical protein